MALAAGARTAVSLGELSVPCTGLRGGQNWVDSCGRRGCQSLDATRSGPWAGRRMYDTRDTG